MGYNDINPRNWFGHVTLENIGEVAEAIRLFLTIDGNPRYYTFVAVNETTGHCTDVRTSQHINADNHNGKPISLTYYQHKADPNDWNSTKVDGPDNADSAHFSVADTYGSWGFSTSARRSDDYNEQMKRGCGVVFSDGQLKIEQYNGFGEVLLWVIAPEQHAGEPYWTEDGTSYKPGRYAWADDSED